MSPPRNAARVPEVEPPVAPPEVQAPEFRLEIPPDTYAGRERYAAQNAVSGRFGHPGVIAGLRDAINKAAGKTVVLTITTK